MGLTTSNEFLNLENWLLLLINTYNRNPSNALAKTISAYLTKLLNHDDIYDYRDRRCDYLRMQRFWRWQAAN